MDNQITAERLKSLGLTKVGTMIEKKLDIKRRAAIAYEFYRVASKEVIAAFDARLKERTLRITVPCPQCLGKGKEHLFHGLPKVTFKGNKNIEAQDCTYCRRTGAQSQTFDKLRFTAIAEYGKVPPEPCLAQLEVAVQRNCFDSFEVADIETIIERPDPIIFGRIKGSDDRFFITQWDDDVDINDILSGK